MPPRPRGHICRPGPRAEGWQQISSGGSPEELPNIKHRRAYDKDALPRPDWRITCFWVDQRHRGHGIAWAALEGALVEIAGPAAVVSR